MSETVSKKLAVTFNDGLPLGVHGSFTYAGEKWIAVPLVKWQRVLAVSDKLLSILARVRSQLTRRVSAHPADAVWIVPVLADADGEELVREKIEAQTS